MFTLKNASIARKILITNAPIIAILVIVLFFFISIYASKSAQSSAEMNIKEAALLVNSSFNNLIGQLKENSKNSMSVFKYFLESNYGSSTEFEIRGKNADGYPEYYLYDNLLTGNTEVLDKFSSTTFDIATVFARDGDDFIRITTSLKDADGNRAIWTKLDHNHPAYNLVLKLRPTISCPLLIKNSHTALSPCTPILVVSFFALFSLEKPTKLLHGSYDNLCSGQIPNFVIASKCTFVPYPTFLSKP